MGEKLNIEMQRLLYAKPSFTVVAMPDFFIDHFIETDMTIEDVAREFYAVAERGGGNIFKNTQHIRRGRCAANFSAALGKLNVNVKLITLANKLGMNILIRECEGVDLSHVKIVKDQAITTIIETKRKGRRINIMLSFPSILSKFTTKNLEEEDWETILKSDFTCIFSWNINLRGNELVREIFQRVKNCGRGRTYLDLGDPSNRIEELKDLIKILEKEEFVDALSLNENELRRVYEQIFNFKGEKDFETMIVELSEKLNPRLDIHTPEYSATVKDGEITLKSTFKVKVHHTTGAGDSWNAGNIFGWGLSLSDEERLEIANSVAAYYISNPYMKHPSRIELIEFLKKQG
ncbi:MAG TPA: carbohydrate kinase family protein [Candidatus Bathyarchaeota archaeon]|nr:carbohydrate kinase family protein [Candidatus Bathyarchaeota archaeon]